MSDYMIRGTAADGEIRFFAAYTKDTAEFARNAHNLSPVAAAALGRLLTGGVMMGAMLKNDEDILTLKIDCDGPIGGLTVTADPKGNVKGYVKNPDVDLPPNDKGKLDVGGALDLGVLSVIKDEGLKEPYIGQTILQTGEIAEDLTYYFVLSEQTPSSVALGVLLDKETGHVRHAGGFILQMMPNAREETISRLEERLSGIISVTSYFEEGKTVEDMMDMILAGMDHHVTETIPCGFHCDCSYERTAEVIGSLPKKEIREMIDEGEDVEVVCHFCNKKYVFPVDVLKGML
ncbi:MAG: Hsp33 family molecular chaperone HslO [Lachnospiraceae bacterium]|nr:Hsp33 family molecular chaperone HslO [Lachnospiraceae bacterium]